MATAKKSVREGTAYPGFRKAAEEEFGDALWYLAAICRRLQTPLEEIFTEATRHENFKNVSATSDIAEGALAYIAVPVDASTSLDATLIRLGQQAAILLGSNFAHADLIVFARAYLYAIHAAKLTFSEVVHGNLQKARGIFLEPQPDELAELDFDKNFGAEEQLPRKFKSLVS